MKLRQAWVIAELLGAFKLFGQYKRNSAEWVSIQSAMILLKSVNVARDLVIYQIGIMACVVALVFSGIVMEIAVILCTNMSLQSKFIAIFITASINFALTLGCLSYFLASGRWLAHAAKYNTRVADVARKANMFS